MFDLRDFIRVLVCVGIIFTKWAWTFESMDHLVFSVREIVNNGVVQEPSEYPLIGAYPPAFRWDPTNVASIPNVHRVMHKLRTKASKTAVIATAPEYGVALSLAYIPSIREFVFNPEVTENSKNTFTCGVQYGGKIISAEFPERITLRYQDIHGEIKDRLFENKLACVLTLFSQDGRYGRANARRNED